jgi:hypothetical protein
MPIFYTKVPTKAYTGANTQSKFFILPEGTGKEIFDEIGEWLVYKEGSVFRFVRAEEVLYKPRPLAPVDIREDVAALKAWAMGVGFKS